jgi:hypothetical protein
LLKDNAFYLIKYCLFAKWSIFRITYDSVETSPIMYSEGDVEKVIFIHRDRVQYLTGKEAFHLRNKGTQH